MKMFSLLSILCFFSVSLFSQAYTVTPLLQKFATLNTVKKLSTNYYHQPVMVLIGYHEKVGIAKKESLFRAVRSLGFTDSAVMVMLPQYPGTKLKDSLKQVCSDRNIGSILQINFLESSENDFMRITISNPIKKGMNIAVNYMGWDAAQKKYIEPCVTLYYQIDESLNEKFLNAVAGN